MSSGGRGEAAVHLVAPVAANGGIAEGEFRGGSGNAQDAAAVERQRAAGDAGPVRVGVLCLNRVAEQEVAPTMVVQDGFPLAAPHRQGQPGIAGWFDPDGQG